ncbi:2'-5' RNA ligase family protein [Halobacterium zhouii]|uniref:2'-5' RNA ligase family protein n=1 Tax=Halobacterium zhouii TaxID=2902624 RepID=UPI001E2BF672|nr:2'-5' RNA ligase family protein [Halobacterium zhouii]
MPGFWRERDGMTLETTTDADVEERDVDRHLVFLARVTDDAVQESLRPTLDDLSGFDCLATVPERYLHVTVTLAGNVGSDRRFSPADEERIAADAREAFAGVDSFEVSFPRLDLFPSVVFAAVADGGAFADLNDRACGIDGVEVHDRDEGFVPHATLAQFRSDQEYDELLSWLEDDRTLSAPSMRVTEVELIAVAKNSRFPRFETVERYPLAE